MSRTAIAGVLAAGFLLSACEREDRQFQPEQPAGETPVVISQSSLSPGPGAPAAPDTAKGEEIQQNAYLMNEGKRLYIWMNCSGCHFRGGGGIGPPLMDDQWIYGAKIENIVQTIREGRPNGMPSFRGTISDDQIWQIAGYVRSMSGLIAKDVAPSRDDDINARPAENRTPPAPAQAGPAQPPQ